MTQPNGKVIIVNRRDELTSVSGILEAQTYVITVK